MTATTAMLTDFAPEATRPAAIGMTQGAVRAWLRLEGLAAFIAGLALCGSQRRRLAADRPLLLLPDISAAGYLPSADRRIHPQPGPQLGARITVPRPGIWLASPTILLVAAILIAHVGMDRAVGYGLKLPGSFHDTHLGRMGRAKA
jgi:hypothetical protein